MPIEFHSIKGIAGIAAALLLLGLAAQADTAEPFDLSTAAAPDATLSATWQELQAQMEAERPVIARCRTEPLSCRSVPAAQFLAIVAAGAAYEGLARIGHINMAANLAIRAVPDGMPDPTDNKWTSPLAALKAGAGDCKQFAVLKYAALEAAGIAADDVRIIILEQQSSAESHAVVAVRNDARWFILDNRSMALVESEALLDRYVPLYSLDHRGVRQFIQQPQVAQKFGGACAG